jgi:hypothetical protein
MQRIQYRIDPLDGVTPSNLKKQAAKTLNCHPQTWEKFILYSSLWTSGAVIRSFIVLWMYT